MLASANSQQILAWESSQTHSNDCPIIKYVWLFQVWVKMHNPIIYTQEK